MTAAVVGSITRIELTPMSMASRAVLRERVNCHCLRIENELISCSFSEFVNSRQRVGSSALGRRTSSPLRLLTMASSASKSSAEPGVDVYRQAISRVGRIEPSAGSDTSVSTTENESL